MAQKINLVRGGALLLVAVTAGPIMMWAGLIAFLSILQQFVAGIFDLSQASWSSFLNPWVWFGAESIGGTGGIMDALVGGPGAPGGTVSRYLTFMIFAFIAAICYATITATWNWAKATNGRVS